MKFISYTRCVATAFVALLFTDAALAHSHLVRSQPPKAAVVTASPKQIELEFKDDVTLTAVTIESAGQKKISLAPFPTAKQKIFAIVCPALAVGVQTINWRAVGADGHVMTGKFAFTVGASK